MFAANLEHLAFKATDQRHIIILLFDLYNFVFCEIFVGSTSPEVQHPWISKITTEPKKSQKNRFSGSILKCF